MTAKHRRDFVTERMWRKIIDDVYRRREAKDKEETAEEAYDRAMRGI